MLRNLKDAFFSVCLLSLFAFVLKQHLTATENFAYLLPLADTTVETQLGLENIRRKVNQLEYISPKNDVSLMSNDMQMIGRGFTVGRLQTEEFLSGVKVNGLICNNGGLDRIENEFEIWLSPITDSDPKGEYRTNTFGVDKIRSGQCVKFTVSVPDIKIVAAKTNTALIVCKSGRFQFTIAE